MIGNCEYCGQWRELDVHHVLNAANRKNSDKYDCCKMNICRDCHRYIHDHPIIAKQLKAKAQKKWEETIGTREEWLKIFRRNYL